MKFTSGRGGVTKGARKRDDRAHSDTRGDGLRGASRRGGEQAPSCPPFVHLHLARTPAETLQSLSSKRAFGGGDPGPVRLAQSLPTDYLRRSKPHLDEVRVAAEREIEKVQQVPAEERNIQRCPFGWDPQLKIGQLPSGDSRETRIDNRKVTARGSRRKRGPGAFALDLRSARGKPEFFRHLLRQVGMR